MVRAVLAGGLVLGIGAAVTLAAWNDSEFVNGTFKSGIFVFEGSTTDGTTFTDHNTSPGGALTFSTPVSNLSPGDSVSAPFAIRLGTGTTTGANVAITLNSSTNATNLTYSLVQKAAWGCASANATAAPLATGLPSNSAFTNGAAGAITLTTPTVGNPGTPAYFCFTVTAGAGLVQNTTSTAIWQFAATSN